MSSVTEPKPRRRAWWAWALYDVANSSFYLLIVAALFPIFYQGIYVAAQGGVESPKLLTQGGSALAFTATVAMALVAILGPVLGAVADRSGGKKKFLAAFAGLGVVATALMVFIGETDVLLASVLYATGTVGVAGSIVFYDALLPAVAQDEEMHRLSAFGFAAGYLGSVLLFVGDYLAIENWAALGFASKGAAVRAAFLSVAVWWALFTIPILLWVREPPARAGTGGNVWLDGFRQLGVTLRKARQYRQLLLFLIAFWIYSDGIGTIIKLAGPFGKSLGVADRDVLQAYILTQIIGVPCALAFGWLARDLGAKRMVLFGLAVYAAICGFAVFMSQTWHFYALAATVGLVQGGTQALSRSFFATLIPKGQSGEFFGFFSTMEKFAGLAGPLLLALLWRGGGDPRRGILALSFFFVLGGVLLVFVNEKAGRAAAQAADHDGPA